MKITADKIADCGEVRCITFSRSSAGYVVTNIAGMIAKYFATSLAIENVVSAPRVMSSCLPISTMSISFVGFESRSTMLPASFAADVPVFIATPTSACASAGASFVPSPVIATSMPPSCSLRISAILVSGVASARKSSTPDSCAIAAAVSGLSPVIMTVRMPMRRSWSNRSTSAVLDDVLELDDAHRDVVLRDGERRSARPRDALDRLVELGWQVPPGPAADRVHGALADLAAVEVHAAHPRLRGERDELGVGLHEVALAQAEALLREHDDRATLGGLVGERGHLRDLGELALVDAGRGRNATACRFPRVIVPVLSSSSADTSPAASTARPLIASTLRWTSRSIPAIPIADSSAPIVVGIRHTNRAISTASRHAAARVDGERLEGHDHHQEDDRELHEQDATARSRSASSGARRLRRARSSGR